MIHQIVLYINDMPTAIETPPRLFADDTCLIINHENVSTLQDKMNMELKKLHNWCNVNKLTINPSKSTAILISPKLNTQITNVNITIDNSPITISETAKYLGVMIDSKLNFQNHIKIIESKLSRLYMKNCHPLSYFLIFSKNSCKFSIALPDPVQTKTNCIFLFIALTACNVASGIRTFPSEVDSRTQGSRPRPRTQKNFEAKA